MRTSLHQFQAGTHCSHSARPSATDSCPSARLRFRSFPFYLGPPEKYSKPSTSVDEYSIAPQRHRSVSRWPNAFKSVGPNERRPRSESSRSPLESPSFSSWSSSSSLPSAAGSHPSRRNLM
ncbi:unnamed protein product [Macrosiphum euphorbiae]|nr:unnamed protein product [Macrosiphum euphorbiae]